MLVVVVLVLWRFADGRMVSGSRDNTLRLWDIETGQSVLVREQPRNMVTHLCRAKNELFLAQTSEDKELKWVHLHQSTVVWWVDVADSGIPETCR